MMINGESVTIERDAGIYWEVEGDSRKLKAGRVRHQEKETYRGFTADQFDDLIRRLRNLKAPGGVVMVWWCPDKVAMQIPNTRAAVKQYERDSEYFLGTISTSATWKDFADLFYNYERGLE